MLYIFDLANVIVDIDFNRVLGVWSDLSRVPLATLQNRFAMDESFQQHERGEISDQVFAEKMCEKLDLALGFEQFTVGWLAGWLAGSFCWGAQRRYRYHAGPEGSG
ncbi:MAG: Alpha-D-glucose 1-phosphate phosphatase YihX [Candidatus Erwinia impunctatus]|nr:Alpha-D-glucose 1-phosphate phosphatase YihX [Culicoides impunctatus]